MAVDLEQTEVTAEGEEAQRRPAEHMDQEEEVQEHRGKEVVLMGSRLAGCSQSCSCTSTEMFFGVRGTR